MSVYRACIDTVDTETKKPYKMCEVIHEYLLSNAWVILLSLLELMFSPCLFIIKMEKLFHMHFYTKSLGVVAVFWKRRNWTQRIKGCLCSFLVLNGFIWKGTWLMEGIWLDGMAWYTPVFCSDLKANLRLLVYNSCYTSIKANTEEVLNIVLLPVNYEEECSSYSAQLKSQGCFHK